MAKFSLEFETDRGPLRQEYTSSSVSIGRDPSSDIHLDHPTVSRQHALIIEHPQGYTLVVLSQNGLTAINGQQVTNQAELSNGVTLNFGQVTAIFSSAHVAATAPVARIPHTEVATQPTIQHEARTEAIPVVPGQSFGAPGGFGQGTGNFAQPSFGAPQQPAQGFGQGGMGGTGNFAQPAFGQGTGNFAQPNAGAQGFGTPAPAAAPAPAEKAAQPQTGHGIISWDQIAAQADSAKESKEETNYEKLQNASKKGQGETNPIVLIVGAIGLIGMGYFLFFYDDSPASFQANTGGGGEQDRVIYEPLDFDCPTPKDCLDKAENRYAVGAENLRRKEVDVSNLFMAYLNLDMADRFYEAAESKEPADLDAKREEAAIELDDKERDLKVRFHQAQQKSQHEEMYKVLVEAKAFFPDKRSRTNKWAVSKETMMKVNGIMPKPKKR